MRLWLHRAATGFPVTIPGPRDSMTLTSKIFFVCKDFSWRLCGDPG